MRLHQLVEFYRSRKNSPFCANYSSPSSKNGILILAPFLRHLNHLCLLRPSDGVSHRKN